MHVCRHQSFARVGKNSVVAVFCDNQVDSVDVGEISNEFIHFLHFQMDDSASNKTTGPWMIKWKEIVYKYAVEYQN